MHLISVGAMPLAGGYEEGKGLVPLTLFAEGASLQQWKAALMQAWDIREFPKAFHGTGWSGQRQDVSVTGTFGNELMPMWTLSESAGPEPIFWTGDLDLQVLPPVAVSLEGPDRAIVESECIARGTEVRYNLDNSRWYLDPLDAEEREKIPTPLTGRDLVIVSVSPASGSNVVLAECRYRVDPAPGATPMRGPVLAYDRAARAIRWVDSIDLDEHSTFVRIEGTIFLLANFYCDMCETGGYQLFELAVPAWDAVRKIPTGTWDIVFKEDRHGIGATSSWFPSEEEDGASE